jgi:hypothetical protein
LIYAKKRRPKSHAWAPFSKDELHTSVEENTCKTSSFTYDSATGVDTAWSCCTVNILYR